MKTDYLYIVALSLLVASCGNHTSENETEATEVEVTDVTLTNAQVKQLEIAFGPMPMHDFAGEVEANGKLAVAPQSQASVSPVTGGNIKQILVHVGQTVTSGQILATLTHPDLLEKQSRYLDAYNRLIYVASEYQRQQKLYNEKIGSGKDYQQIHSEYQLLQGQLRMTESQLRMMGINPESIVKGETVTSITLRAPISGTVEEINAHTGQYVDSQQEVFHIVNFNDVYADLLVFEKDLPLIRVGQTVNFDLKSSSRETFTGKITSIGKIFDSTPKATHVRASIEGSAHEFAEGLYLCGKIISDAQRSPALSTEGVVDYAGKTYAFTATQSNDTWTFHPVEVSRIREEKGFVEIQTISQVASDAQFALSGAYYILSEMKKTETGEED